MDGYRVDGPRLRALRERHGVYRTELAEKADVSLSYLKYIEAGYRQPSVVVVYRIANNLGVDITEFCDPVDDSANDAGAA
jgi:transcriptional regulator with XRE-family HTH domain